MAKGIYLPRDLIESAAFHHLPGTAKEILLYFLLKREFPTTKIKGKKKRICTNHGRINFAYSEAKKKGFTQPRFTRAVDELLAKGFISIVHPGGAFDKDKAVFALLTEPGTNRKWFSWQPGQVLEVRNREPIRRGFCKPRDGNI